MNALYNAFSAHIARLTEKGATASDIKRLQRFASEKTCELASACVDAGVVAKMTNQKSIMRLAQALDFIVSGNVRSFDKATAYLVAALALSKQATVSYHDMHYLIGAPGSDSTAHIKGVSRAKMHKVLSSITSMGTITSQVSRTVGANGFLTVFGIVTKSDKHGVTIANREHPILVAYAAQLQRMTDGALELAVSGNK